ncbi:mechanosensitive ion channel [Rhizobium sp. P38BS-XIX]|uniref:mechanosensitive ion channel domain-containing protein n=1 Tax=Rhizobium sp. P38BS-XIX TaxID=2726740 RepID=UPI0014574598|nr:mechanosensitive ion channel domain-containing protein [Rhizobium sp. P38BS-XIX]NLS00792.1 mechanosensitive ion channel [Rhizobium sp. P38BS-XIX]
MKNFLLACAMFFSFACVAMAQQTSAVSNAGASAEKPAAPDPLAALVEVMKDDKLRNQLIEQIEQTKKLRVESAATPASQNGSAKAAGTADKGTTDEEPGQGQGLVAALVASFRELGERVPTAALGAPVDVKIGQAQAQIETRLSAPDAESNLRSFSIKSVAGWALITAAALFVLMRVRRRIRSRLAKSVSSASLVREATFRALLGLLPLLLCFIVAAAWFVLLDYGSQARAIFVLLTSPFAFALASSELTACLLLFLVRSKGWRVVAYAQRRLAPLVGLLSGIAVASSLANVPEIRIAIGPATADLASLILDLAVPLFALYIILRHRRTVRTLIVRGRHIDEYSTSLNRATVWLAAHWHQLGIAFVVLNVFARLFGARNGSFLSQSFVSVAVIVIALIASAALGRFLNTRMNRRKRPLRTRMREVVIDRFGSLLFRLVRLAIAAGAVIACLGLWGFDIIGWASHDGASVFQSVFSIASVIFVTWALWVILDAWISDALSPSTDRQRSARVMTLLPLLRNVAFVALSALTIIGVLSNIGINVAPLIAGAGVVGLAVGFGSQQLVQDVITGLFMLLEDTIAIGDVVDTGDRAGTVEGMTIRTVKIRDGDGALHSIPFSTIKAIKNRSRGFGVYTVSVTLDVQADIEEAIRIFKVVGEEIRTDSSFASKIVAPFDVWGVDQVGLDGVVLKGAVKTLPLQQWGVGREINRRYKERLQAAGINLASRSITPLLAPTT